MTGGNCRQELAHTLIYLPSVSQTPPLAEGFKKRFMDMWWRQWGAQTKRLSLTTCVHTQRSRTFPLHDATEDIKPLHIHWFLSFSDRNHFWICNHLCFCSCMNFFAGFGDYNLLLFSERNKYIRRSSRIKHEEKKKKTRLSFYKA